VRVEDGTADEGNGRVCTELESLQVEGAIEGSKASKKQERLTVEDAGWDGYATLQET